MAVRRKNRGLIYLRRSGDRQETSLEKQLTWAFGAARDHGVIVDATLEDLQYMQANRLHFYKSLRLDDAITGADLERPGLKALVNDAINDPQNSHVFAFKRDRLGRPESPVEMMAVEAGLHHDGITVVLSDGVSSPSINDDGSDLAGLAMMLFEYYRSGKFLRELAEQMVLTQLQLANKGFWTGGNAPYGFTRALANDRGEILEELPRGKRVRQAGCHVVIIPKDMEKIETWIYLLTLKEQGWGFKRIVRHLNELGIPSPDAGRIRTDHGVPHEVSGRWNITTVRELCMNRSILGLLDYGRRSEGKHRRLGKDGARCLEDADRNDQKKPKVVMNPQSLIVTSRLPAEPQFDPARWEKIQEETRRRSRVQRGIPRSRDPARYPLSCRVIDLSDGCHSAMYGRAHGQRLIYACGKYMATGGAECENNTVDAEAMLKFTLDTLGELTDRLGSRDKLRQKLLERAAREQPEDPLRLQHEQQRARLQASVSQLERDLGAARRNYATEEEPSLRSMIREELVRLQQEFDQAKRQMAAIPEPLLDKHRTPEEEAGKALKLQDEIQRIATDAGARAQVLPLLQRIGLRVGLRYVDATKKTRRVRRLAGGLISLGGTPFPGEDKAGFTSPKSGVEDLGNDLKKRPQIPCGSAEDKQHNKNTSGSSCVLPEADQFRNGPREGVSFTKDSRGDRI
jgi:DNA invertase Pin-like site-specific DNA recombinase